MNATERKLQLTRFLREENTMNRMRMRSREEILYGAPLVYSGHLGEEGYEELMQPQAGKSMLGLRIAAAILVFAGIVYLDRTQTALFGAPVSQIILNGIGVSMEGQLQELLQAIPRF